MANTTQAHESLEELDDLQFQYTTPGHKKGEEKIMKRGVKARKKTNKQAAIKKQSTADRNSKVVALYLF